MNNKSNFFIKTTESSKNEIGNCKTTVMKNVAFCKIHNSSFIKFRVHFEEFKQLQLFLEPWIQLFWSL